MIGGLLIKPLVYESRFDTCTVNKYVDYLINAKLIDHINKGKRIFKLTNKGRAYMKLYKEIEIYHA